MPIKIDHLVYGAKDLTSGTKWMTDYLGVEPAGGGVHDFMGTHNTLWRLDNIYLEVIAINPDGKAPNRPRWFGLDDPKTHHLIKQTPKLLTWVLEVNDIDQALEASTYDHGRPITMSRGDFNWTVTVPDDGMPKINGALPGLISWHSSHPVTNMADSGVALSSLELPIEAKEPLEKIGADHLVRFGNEITVEFNK